MNHQSIHSTDKGILKQQNKEADKKEKVGLFSFFLSELLAINNQ